MSKKLKKSNKNGDSNRPSLAITLTKKQIKDDKHARKKSLEKQHSNANLHRRVFSNRDDDSTKSKENFNQVVVLEKTPYDNNSGIKVYNHEFGQSGHASGTSRY